MTQVELAGLHSEIFASFIDKHLEADCRNCPDRDCFSRWLLLDTGEVRAIMTGWSGDLPDHWCSWPQCPRRTPPVIVSIDQGVATLGEACRWAMERGVHQIREEPDQGRGLSARGSFLLREWSRIKDRPTMLREHIRAMKWRAKHPDLGYD